VIAEDDAHQYGEQYAFYQFSCKEVGQNKFYTDTLSL